jgi:hypothetical protein
VEFETGETELAEVFCARAMRHVWYSDFAGFLCIVLASNVITSNIIINVSTYIPPRLSFLDCRCQTVHQYRLLRAVPGASMG